MTRRKLRVILACFFPTHEQHKTPITYLPLLGTFYNVKFYRRLLVWKTQARLVDGGMSLLAANQRIHTITGGKTVTAVIDKLIAFKRAYAADGGVHPELRNG